MLNDQIMTKINISSSGGIIIIHLCILDNKVGLFMNRSHVIILVLMLVLMAVATLLWSGGSLGHPVFAGYSAS